MKKIIAAALALALLLLSLPASFAAGETVTEVRWETYESLIAESGIEASFYPLGDTGVRVWIPHLFKSINITDEYAARGVIAAFSLDDASGFIEVILLEGGTATIQSTYADMQELKLYPALADINGMEAVTCMVPDTDVYSLMVMFEPGRFLQFLFYPMANSAMNSLTAIIASSIQKEGLVPSPARPVEEAEVVSLAWADAIEKARTADPDGRMLQIGDLHLCMWTPSVFFPYKTPEDRPDVLAWFAIPDGSASVTVLKADGRGVSLQAWRQGLLRYGYADASLLSVNDIPALAYTDSARDSLNVLFEVPGADGLLQFSFTPYSEEGFASVAALMLASVQAFTPDP